jgi:AmiR/NasT family two-component response regulator
MSDHVGTPRRAIICEDEALTSATLARHLARLGYEVVARPNDGTEAVKAATAMRPDLILMDIMMPKMDGLRAARSITSKLDTTVVIITAFVDDNLVERAAQAGVGGYLVKPVSLDQLRVAVHVAEEGSRRLRQAKADASAARRQLENRKLIERAKGILMDTQRLSEQDAYRSMQRQSQDERRRMVELAEEIVRAQELIDGPRGDGLRRRAPRRKRT